MSWRTPPEKAVNPGDCPLCWTYATKAIRKKRNHHLTQTHKLAGEAKQMIEAGYQAYAEIEGIFPPFACKKSAFDEGYLYVPRWLDEHQTFSNVTISWLLRFDVKTINMLCDSYESIRPAMSLLEYLNELLSSTEEVEGGTE